MRFNLTTKLLALPIKNFSIKSDHDKIGTTCGWGEVCGEQFYDKNSCQESQPRNHQRAENRSKQPASALHRCVHIKGNDAAAVIVVVKCDVEGIERLQKSVSSDKIDFCNLENQHSSLNLVPWSSSLPKASHQFNSPSTKSQNWFRKMHINRHWHNKRNDDCL